METVKTKNGQELRISFANVSNEIEVLSLQDKSADWLESQGHFHWIKARRSSARYLADLNNGQILLLRDIEDEKLIGVVAMVSREPQYHTEEDFEVWQDPLARAKYMKKLCIDPDYQSQGLARILVDHVIEFSIQNGAEYLRLDVNQNVKSLAKFYESTGFVQKAEMPERILMEKKLELIP